MSKGLVLVVDLDAESREQTAKVLNGNGFETISTGLCVSHAINLVDESGPRPDIIVMDACHTCRSQGHPTTDLRVSCGIGEIPVVLLTARSGVEHHDCAFRAGVQKYLLKPCDPVELTLAIEELLERQRLADHHDADASEVAGLLSEARKATTA